MRAGALPRPFSHKAPLKEMGAPGSLSWRE